MKVEIHELKVGQKILLIDLEGKKENVNLKLKEGNFYEVDMLGVTEYKDPSLISVGPCVEKDEFLEIDNQSLLLITVETSVGITTAMIDFRNLDGNLPGLFLLPMDYSAEQILGLISTQKSLLDHQDIFLFNKLSAKIGVS